MKKKNKLSKIESIHRQLTSELGEYLSESDLRIQSEFDYKKESDREEINEALAVWRFLLQLFLRLKNSTENEIELLEIKRSWIKEMLIDGGYNKKNKHFRTVGIIESLPTTVWRKLLWRENIDFSSLESCLRRLNSQQKKALEDNYSDLLEAKIPRVMKKSWGDRLKIFLGVINTKKIMEEGYDHKKRNMSKSSWAFNLLGLDFGFSLYPKGENNDEMITNKKFTRFLSVKEHIDDFVVNTEDGKYFQAYKSARSNYVLRPKKKVELSAHVCPGFWYTLVIHFIFWIISPIAITVSMVAIASNGLSWGSVLPAVPGALMILWIIFATVKILFKVFIQKPFQYLGKKVFKDAVLEKIKKVIAIILVIIFAIFLLVF